MFKKMMMVFAMTMVLASMAGASTTQQNPFPCACDGSGSGN
jgi:hypothetical protein